MNLIFLRVGCLFVVFYVMFLLLHSQNVSVKSQAVLFVFPDEGKTSVYYAMQALKVQLPRVVVKVSKRSMYGCCWARLLLWSDQWK